PPQSCGACRGATNATRSNWGTGPARVLRGRGCRVVFSDFWRSLLSPDGFNEAGVPTMGTPDAGRRTRPLRALGPTNVARQPAAATILTYKEAAEPQGLCLS